jgi:hypothetical protein
MKVRLDNHPSSLVKIGNEKKKYPMTVTLLTTPYDEPNLIDLLFDWTTDRSGGL